MISTNGHSTRFKIAQELFLLALHPVRGTLRSPHLNLGLAGALLMELSLHGRITLQRKRVIVVDSAATGDPLLDRLLLRLDGARRPRSLKRWVRSLSSGRPALHRLVGASLADHNIVRVERRRRLGLIPYSAYPPLDPLPRQRTVDRLRHCILDRSELDAPTATLASIANTLRLLREHFTRDERVRIRDVMKQLRRDDQFSRAVGDTIAEMHAAVAGAVAASTAAASSSGSN
ncbi:MAG: hypothetical protein MAG453_00251 [Calditrichaeota bacterium]|nr:hypothetical protein [Calditrichota bacterium]